MAGNLEADPVLPAQTATSIHYARSDQDLRRIRDLVEPRRFGLILQTEIKRFLAGGT